MTNAAAEKTNTEAKKFESKYGYFTADGREYVITRPDTPRPWVNVICYGGYGIVESQTGSGFSFLDNSNLSRVTRWEQDLIRDSWGKYLYVRDAESGEFWSATWKPTCPKFDEFEARYGQGYSTYKSSLNQIRVEKTIFVDTEDPVEVWKVTVTNTGSSKRKIDLFSYFEWCLGNAADTHREFQKTFIETEIDKTNQCIFGRKRPALVPGFISTGLTESPLEAFHGCSEKPKAYEGDKEAFFGRYGEIQAPKCVVDGKMNNTDGRWVDSIAGLQVGLDLAAGESKTVYFTVGAAYDHKKLASLAKKYQDPKTAEASLAKAKKYWDDILTSTWVKTPDESLDFMTNIWLKYQAMSARLWARCAYYQSSGGFGYRDQLQDCQIFFYNQTELAKKQILLHAEQQFTDGTVHHWWHQGTGMGAITEMTDDLLWLAFITLNYIDETQDEAILDIMAKFLPDKKTKEVTEGTVFDHCCRAIDKVLSRWSPRGLPLIGEGDWNDGMSHVGIKWKGESIWLGHFLYGVLTRIAPYCEAKGEKDRAADYLKRAEDLKKAINEHAWDGEWYIRATRDDGKPLGSKECKEGKIFLNAQTWSVINETATEERGKQAMAACEKHLFREYGPLLFTPAFTVTDPNIGYLSRYAPSVRENGGLYTHAGTWAIQAMAKLREGDKAYKVYNSFNPIQRGKDPDHYFGEPYVTPGNVDGPDSPNFGRGGWTWYTGSGSWYAVVILNWLLGVRPVKDGLKIDPVIPKEWQGFSVKRAFRGATYNIEVKNPKGAGQGVTKLTLDGKEVSGDTLPSLADGKEHQVEVTLG